MLNKRLSGLPTNEAETSPIESNSIFIPFVHDGRASMGMKV